MDIEYIKENYYFEILNEKHDLSNFECDSNDLTNFLKNDALKQQDMNLNLTQLVICDNEIVGFFSLLTDTLKLKTLENNNLKKEIKLELDISENNEIPARNILLSILNLSKTKVGLRFVTVDAYATSLNFYVKKNNFSSRKSDTETLKKIDKIKKQNPNRSFILYLDLKDINCSKD